MKMKKKIFLFATIIGLFAIILGAFSAHSLRSLLNKSSLESFQTGVQYQIYHSFFLFFLGLIPYLDKKEKKYILILTLTGIFLFCFSIYLLATNSQTSIDFSFIGPVTPIGGLILILAWSLLFFYILKKKNHGNYGS
tara:strand:+ start:17776 stop:18186 length:411 start_codon:yes stop_codon:yes gene_type:complete